MQSTRHVDKPAASIANASARHLVDVIVLTSDPGLLDTLREAAGSEHAVWPAPSANAAVDLLINGRCGILIVDLGTLGEEASALLSRLHAQFPELVLLATGTREEEAWVAALVSSGHVYRFLHQPISPARGTTFLGAATRRHHELRDAQSVMLSTVRTLARRPQSKRITLIGAFAIAIIILAFIIWALRAPTTIEVSAPTTRAQEPSEQEQIADFLGRARIAQATGRLAEPRGDNAVEYYQEVLTMEPDHGEARIELDRVIAALEARVNEALRAGSPAEGKVALESLQRARPSHPQLQPLQRQLAALMQARRTPPPVAQAPSTPESRLALDDAIDDASAMEANDDEAQSAAASASEHIERERAYADAMEQLALSIRLRERGNLHAPADHNAFDTLQALAVQHPELEPVRTEQQRLAFRFLELTRLALSSGEFDQAALFLDRAERLVPGMSTTQGLRAQLEVDRRERELAESIIPAANLKLRREVRAQYPTDANIRGIEGWVDVEFTIQPDGTTTNLVVREASPPGVFERASLEALRRWRFEPVMREGQAVAQRATLRMKYSLE